MDWCFGHVSSHELIFGNCEPFLFLSSVSKKIIENKITTFGYSVKVVVVVWPLIMHISPLRQATPYPCKPSISQNLNPQISIIFSALQVETYICLLTP